MDWILAAVTLIGLHNVDGDEILVNAEQITTLHHTKESQGGSNKLVSGGHNCVIGLTNGRMISVVEDCGMVRQAIREAK